MFTNSPAGEWQSASHALRAPDTSIQLYLGRLQKQQRDSFTRLFFGLNIYYSLKKFVGYFKPSFNTLYLI